MTQPTFLMVKPNHFQVRYSINIWMSPKEWEDKINLIALSQWQRLKTIIEVADGKVIVEQDNPNCPDMCFAANAGLVFDNKALLSLFAHPERQKEEAIWHNIFDRLNPGKVVDIMSEGKYIPFEGAGDCLWDATRKIFWLGYGFRSDMLAAVTVMETFNRSVMPLGLVDPRFYHLDMAMCVLPHGKILWYPPAFDLKTNLIIVDQTKFSDLIPVSEADALVFACNMVSVNDTLIVNDGISEQLQNTLKDLGYTVITTPMSAFIKAGGAAGCLTLRLDNKS